LSIFSFYEMAAQGEIKLKRNKEMISLKVRDKMTKTVAYVSPQSSVVEAAQLMQKHNVGSIPVYDQGVVE